MDGQKQFSLTKYILFCFGTSISQFKYLSVSERMLFRECKGKSGGVVVLRLVFSFVLSGKQTSET